MTRTPPTEPPVSRSPPASGAQDASALPSAPEEEASAALAVVGRSEIHHREDLTLSPAAMRAARSAGRQHPETEHPYRTVYMRDRDRIIHSSAFRRLEYKTQVFVNNEGDYYRTRLTHTIEVAQIARTAARALRLNEDLTESIALSHDLGHGPFGHKGEDVLSELMEAYGGFEHNAHGLRVVDLLEVRDPRWRGLNLSYEVREAFARHSPRDPEASGFPGGLRPLLEAQLVDVCDSLTYLAHDCDDAIAAGIVGPEDLCEVELWRRHWELTAAGMPGATSRLQALGTVKSLIDASVSDLVAASLQRIQDTKVSSPESVQAHAHLLVAFGAEMHRLQRRLAHFLHQRFYCHPRLLKMGHKARHVLTQLFGAYRREPRMLSAEECAWAEEVGLERAICDKMAAMTDREAQDEYTRLFSPYERT